jgi:hypothetical protein
VSVKRRVKYYFHENTSHMASPIVVEAHTLNKKRQFKRVTCGSVS